VWSARWSDGPTAPLGRLGSRTAPNPVACGPTAPLGRQRSLTRRDRAKAIVPAEPEADAARRPWGELERTRAASASLPCFPVAVALHCCACAQAQPKLMKEEAADVRVCPSINIQSTELDVCSLLYRARGPSAEGATTNRNWWSSGGDGTCRGPVSCVLCSFSVHSYDTYTGPLPRAHADTTGPGVICLRVCVFNAGLRLRYCLWRLPPCVNGTVEPEPCTCLFQFPVWGKKFEDRMDAYVSNRIVVTQDTASSPAGRTRRILHRPGAPKELASTREAVTARATRAMRYRLIAIHDAGLWWAKARAVQHRENRRRR